MRRFKLINSIGREFDLCRTDAFFASPDGMGLTRQQDTQQIGDDFITTEDRYSPKDITGEMFFKSYDTFSEFADFVSYKPLVLCYAPGDTWYYRDCVCTSLAKSEIPQGSTHLYCAVNFQPLSLWYDSTKVYKSELTDEDTNPFTFPLQFPFTFSDANAGDVALRNSRPRPAPCKITLYGPLTDPSWVLTSSGSSVSSGALSITLTPSERLVIDANPRTMEISKISADGNVIDCSQLQDWNRETFIYAPPGNSVLHVTHEGSSELEVIVEVRQIADAV